MAKIGLTEANKSVILLLAPLFIHSFIRLCAIATNPNSTFTLSRPLNRKRLNWRFALICQTQPQALWVVWIDDPAPSVTGAALELSSYTPVAWHRSRFSGCIGIYGTVLWGYTQRSLLHGSWVSIHPDLKGRVGTGVVRRLYNLLWQVVSSYTTIVLTIIYVDLFFDFISYITKKRGDPFGTASFLYPNITFWCRILESSD